MNADQHTQELRTLVEARLPSFVRHVVEAFGVAGLAIGIVKSGELVYTHGFGVRNRDTEEPCAGYLRHPAVYFILLVDIIMGWLVFVWRFIDLDVTSSRHRIKGPVDHGMDAYIIVLLAPSAILMANSF